MTSPDTAIVKTEVFSIDALNHLMQCDGVSTIDKNRLKKYKDSASKGNEVRVSYLRGKKLKTEEFGRVTPEKGIGLASFPREIRNFLAKKYYFDLDIVNAQPTILEQICKTKGWSCDKLSTFNANRESLMKELDSDRKQAKIVVMRMLFGTPNPNEFNGFFSELVEQLAVITTNLCNDASAELKKIAKKHTTYNEKGSICACVLQQEEFKCLTALDIALTKEGRYLATLINDGGLVRQLDGEVALSSELIEKCQTSILKDTGYALQLKQKDLDTTFVLDDSEDDLLDQSILVDDKYAAEKFRDMMGNNLVRCNDGIYIFNTSNGIWSNNESDVKTAIANAGLVFKQMGKLFVNTFDYSGSVKNMNACFTYLSYVVPNQPQYFLDRIESSLGKMLFKDGIYDFKTDTFVSGFDPEVVFHASVPLTYSSIEVADDIDFVNKNLFENPFSSLESPRVLLHYLMRALIGDFRMKKYLIGVGGTNSGKGTTTELLQQTFGELVSSFNGNSLLLRRGDSEATRELSWVHRIAQTRIAISSEMKMSESSIIDGNLIKSVVSGGDVLTLRQVYKDDVQFVNTSMPIIFCNDLPKFSPADEGLRDRTIVITYDNSFVSDPDFKIPSQKKADPEIKRKLKDVKYSHAMFHLIRKQYKDWKQTEYKDITLPDSMIADKNDWVPLTDFSDILAENYEITHDPEHMVLFDDLHKEFTKKIGEGTYSKTKIGRELAKLGLKKLDKKVNRQTKRFIVGVQFIGLYDGE